MNWNDRDVYVLTHCQFVDSNWHEDCGRRRDVGAFIRLWPFYPSLGDSNICPHYLYTNNIDCANCWPYLRRIKTLQLYSPNPSILQDFIWEDRRKDDEQQSIASSAYSSWGRSGQSTCKIPLLGLHSSWVGGGLHECSTYSVDHIFAQHECRGYPWAHASSTQRKCLAFEVIGCSIFSRNRR